MQHAEFYLTLNKALDSKPREPILIELIESRQLRKYFTCPTHVPVIELPSGKAFDSVRRRSKIFVSLGLGKGRLQEADHSVALNSASKNRFLRLFPSKESEENAIRSLLRSMTLVEQLVTEGDQKAYVAPGKRCDGGHLSSIWITAST